MAASTKPPLRAEIASCLAAGDAGDAEAAINIARFYRFPVTTSTKALGPSLSTAAPPQPREGRWCPFTGS